MKAVALVVRKDLLVLRRAPVLLGTLLAYPLVVALHKMDVGGYRHLPIVTDGRPVGVISVRDLMRHITRMCHD